MNFLDQSIAMNTNNFVETKIATKFGEFNVRVYKALQGQETIVLWTGKINANFPTLVRIHSECITGDMMGSLHCDCGEQFAKSLELIHKEGGALIYLRQEGRGIGLFEKIRTYQLQARGHDTFEANVLLGHRPDARTYEMAKIALADLNIKRIRLLTNNPSKISEITKLGIEVVERVPIVVQSNCYNEKYFSTKRDKFQHFFCKENDYFYQFHADTPEQVIEIGEFLRNRTMDPLLKICVGVGADHKSLGNVSELDRIRSIFTICEAYDRFLPILHFSFRHTNFVVEDIECISRYLPCVKRLQANDLPTCDIELLTKMSSLFQTDIPLCDENFHIIRSDKFRALVNKTNSFLLLDNSKGRGIQEPKESLMKKIDELLSLGLNKIAVFGGFGPNDLDVYFDLRRYYKINFSIDAETKLKSDGHIDIEKTKNYLQQLIRFDDPKQEGVEQTRAFLAQHRRSNWSKVSIRDTEFLVHPEVFHPGFFPSTTWYANLVCEYVKDDTSFCEVGCGAGVVSCLTALTNPKIHVVATDINPFAIENIQMNTQSLEIVDRVEAINCDVLDGISADHQFDSIFWSLPFGFLDPGTKISFEELQVFDPGYRAIRKFFQTAGQFLKPNGKLLVGFSSDLGHPELLQELAEEFGLKLELAREEVLSEGKSVKFELLVGRYASPIYSSIIDKSLHSCGVL